jgi:hypothetical protein
MIWSNTTNPRIWNTLVTGLVNDTILHNTSFQSHLDKRRRTASHTMTTTNAATKLATSEFVKCSSLFKKRSTLFLTAESIFNLFYFNR